MEFKDLFGKVTWQGVLLGAIIIIALLQISLTLLGLIFKSLAGIKLGFAFYIIAAALTLYFIIRFITKKTESIDRSDVFYILLILGVMMLFFWGTQKYIPQMFSITMPDQFEDSAKTVLNGDFGMQSILGTSATTTRPVGGENCKCTGIAGCGDVSNKEDCEAIGCTWKCDTATLI